MTAHRLQPLTVQLEAAMTDKGEGMSIAATEITAEQRAEWFALHKRAEQLARQYDQALHDAGHWIKWGIQHGEPDYARGKAEEDAQEAIAFWAERAEVIAAVEAHPYDAVVQARR